MAKDYINIDLPPGIRSNGTEYNNRGAWVDGSRIRWANNSLRPIGGWTRFQLNGVALPALYAAGSGEISRSLLVWRLNDNSEMFAAATNKKVYAWGGINANAHDITPLDFAARQESVSSQTGYGAWFYGTDAYGLPRPYDPDAAINSAVTWTMRNWGEDMLLAPNGAPSKLYEWGGNFGERASVVTNAPIDFDCFHVTNQRIVMTAGDGTSPRMVKWSDSEDNTDWTPRADNKAGFQFLQGVGRFHAIVQLRDYILLVSETDAYAATYIGAPFVFGFEQLSDNCGTVSPAVLTNGEIAMWPSHNSFFICDGNTVSAVPCDVMDKLGESLDAPKAGKITGFVNPYWTEFWWLYQEGDDEVDSYVYYDWVSRHWGYGKLDRTVGGGYAAIGGLIMVSPAGEVFVHEQDGVLPIDNDMSEVFVESGPIELAKGNKVQYVKTIQPDFSGDGSVNIYLIGRDRPGAPELPFGPFNVNYPALTQQPVPARARGHTVKLRVQGEAGLWSMGSTRLDFNIGGDK